MNRLSFRRSWLFLLILLGFRSSVGDSKVPENSELNFLSPYGDNSQDSAQIGGRSLLSLPLKSKSNTALIAASDGEIHLVDSNSMKKIWSFNSGPPIYSSYQAPMKHDGSIEKASGSTRSFYFDCGDDWELYMHTEHGRMKLPKTIDEVVRITPHIFEDGSVMTGSRKTTVFEIDPVTGKLIRNHTSDISSSGQSNEEHRVVIENGNVKDLIEPGLLNPIEPRLYITRTDYSLKSSFSNSKEVSWSLTVSEIGATLLCPDVENPTQSIFWNLKNNSSFEVDFDFAKPLSCQSKALVFREWGHVVSESSGYRRLSRAHDTHDKLSSSLILPSQSKIDKHLNVHPEKLMLPGPASNEPNASSSLDEDSKAALPMPLMKFYVSRIVQGYTMGRLSIVFLTIMLVGLITFVRALGVKVKQLFLKENPPITFDSKSFSSKRKKVRKSGRSNGNHEKNEVSVGRTIGKLFVTDTVIAKGSNGTIVLEGIYNNNRAVAVKRLVMTHHDVAAKEIKILMKSDKHQNIVTFYGQENDDNFVYLALERCICSLDDLILIFSNPSLNSMFNQDRDSKTMMDYKLHLEAIKSVLPNLNLWKENSRPSPFLVQLMRNMVEGLKHLHGVGIIHRDLKPQNVLIDEPNNAWDKLSKKPVKLLCAKLSDMGISKRLPEDMSSLEHCATGWGSSGWQAPEQLLKGRQTRAVDVFSLGCVLYFCITGGKHPFGDRFERDNNILKNQMDLFLIEDIPEAVDLISRLLNPNPDLRPKASEVLQHPLLWTSEERLSFLSVTSERVKMDDGNSELLKALENTARLALGGKWDEKIGSAIIANIGQYRRYKYDSVRDLLRFIRNKWTHYRDFPNEIKVLIGSKDEGFDGYITRRFPKLLIEVYKVVSLYCREEKAFQKYFEDDSDKFLETHSQGNSGALSRVEIVDVC